MLIVIGACLYRVYTLWLRPTSILVVNALPAQAADIVLNNDCNKIKITCKSMEEAGDFDKYDAVLMYGRGLYLDSIQLCSLGQAASKGIPVFTNTLRNFSFVATHNIDSIQNDRLQKYFFQSVWPQLP